DAPRMTEPGVAVQQIVDQPVGTVAGHVVGMIAVGRGRDGSIVLSFCLVRLSCFGPGEARRAKAASADRAANFAPLSMRNDQREGILVTFDRRRELSAAHLRSDGNEGLAGWPGKEGRHLIALVKIEDAGEALLPADLLVAAAVADGSEIDGQAFALGLKGAQKAVA